MSKNQVADPQPYEAEVPAKKVRKQRADKGVKRGPRKPKTED